MLFFVRVFIYPYTHLPDCHIYWTKGLRKKVFVKRYSPILKYRSHRSYTEFLNEIFINIKQSTSCGYGLNKNVDEKRMLFHG